MSLQGHYGATQNKSLSANGSVDCSAQGTTGVLIHILDPAGGATFTCRLSLDGTNFATQRVINAKTGAETAAGSAVTPSDDDFYYCPTYGAKTFRITEGAGGTATVSLQPVFAGEAMQDSEVTATISGVAQVEGDVAHDSPDGATNNPVSMGGKAIAHGTNPTAVTAADRTNWYFNRAGVPFVIGGHPNIVATEWTVADADGAQTNAALITVGAGTKIVVTKIEALCDKDNTVSVAVRVGFGAATVPAASLAGTNGIVLSHPDIDAGSGLSLGSGSGIIGIGADGEDLRLTCDDPTGGNLVIRASYYTIES